MATYCSHHRTVRVGGDRGLECPCCLAEDRLFTVGHDLPGRRILHDDYASFTDWLAEEQSVDEQSVTDYLIERIRKNPLILLRKWRWDTVLEMERLTIAVIVCDVCHQVVRIDEWRGKDAHEGEAWCISHGRCDACEALGYQEIEARDRAEAKGEAA